MAIDDEPRSENRGELSRSRARSGTRFDSGNSSDLARRLAASDCFCRDTRLGRLYHRNEVSYREIAAADSLHVTVREGGEVFTHIDRHSPLARRQPGGDCRYSPLRIAAHNVSGMAADLVRLAVGRRQRPAGDHVERTLDLAYGADTPRPRPSEPQPSESKPRGRTPGRRRAGERRASPIVGDMERTYRVNGISCDHCKNAIEGEVGKLDGIDQVTVDVATKTVSVAGSASDESVRAAIDEAGYEVDGTG